MNGKGTAARVSGDSEPADRTLHFSQVNRRAAGAALRERLVDVVDFLEHVRRLS